MFHASTYKMSQRPIDVAKKYQTSSKYIVIWKSLDKDLVKLVLNNNVREVDARKANGGGVVLPSFAIASYIISSRQSWHNNVANKRHGEVPFEEIE